MKTRILLLVVISALSMSAFANQSNAQGDKATEIGKKIRQLDLLNQILPVLMTKEQLKAIIPAVQKARNEERVLAQKELKMMAEKEAKVDAAIKEGKSKQLVPSKELVAELSQMYNAFVIARRMMMTSQIEAIRLVMEKNLNKGQIKAAANALNPKIFDPSADLSTITEERKLELWIQNILLDPQAFDILVELSK